MFFKLHVPTKDFSFHLHKTRPALWMGAFEYLKLKIEKFNYSLHLSWRDAEIQFQHNIEYLQSTSQFQVTSTCTASG